jgi:hypothetical protein
MGIQFINKGANFTADQIRAPAPLVAANRTRDRACWNILGIVDRQLEHAILVTRPDITHPKVEITGVYPVLSGDAGGFFKSV